jgi:hypothetical protein
MTNPIYALEHIQGKYRVSRFRPSDGGWVPGKYQEIGWLVWCELKDENEKHRTYSSIVGIYEIHLYDIQGQLEEDLS